MMATMTDENTEVRRARRSWSAQYKLEILAEIDMAKASGHSGAVGEICRREDLYSSLISEWRTQRDAGALAGLKKPVGRPKKDLTKIELARLRGEVERLEADLVTANELIEAQGKVSALLQAISSKSANKNMRHQ
jgi:transposase-like protein